MNDYFKELAEGWEDAEGNLIVRISQIETRILAITGIVDITTTKINGVASNLTLNDDAIPSLGTITAS